MEKGSKVMWSGLECVVLLEHDKDHIVISVHGGAVLVNISEVTPA